MHIRRLFYHNIPKVGRPLFHHSGSGVADHLLDGDLVDDFVGQHLAEQEDGRDAAVAWSMISSTKMVVKLASMYRICFYNHS